MRENEPGIHFATTNTGKFKEAAEIFQAYGIPLKRLNVEKHEIQADNVAKIAEYSAQQLALSGKVREVVAEDSGFFVDSLKGFPGPYSSYIYKTIGSKGILKLMRNVKNREASFASAVAYCTVQDLPVCFRGLVKGTVITQPRGKSGFGFDPIFTPKYGDGRTFGQMDVEEKNRFSHRAKAFAKFCEWYKFKESASNVP